MKIDRHLHRRLRLQNIAFVLLFLTFVVLLGWLSMRYHHQFDWTASQRNSLSEESVRLLGTMDGPIAFTAFVRPDSNLRRAISELVGRYTRQREDITLEIVNPDTEPERVRELDIAADGELVIDYAGRTEKLQSLTEQNITNALQRLARQGARWLVFLQGHGERDPYGQANHDLGDFGRELSRRGLTVQTLNLGISAAIPDNTTVLVIAGPQTALLPGEVKLIIDYLDAGGNLLWLSDPEEDAGLQPLAEYLGVYRLPGVVVDPTARRLGINNVGFTLVAEYPFHPVTRGLATLTLYPRAAALEHEAAGDDWAATPLLETLPRSWTETGQLAGEIRYDEGTEERAGPLPLAFALTRDRGEAEGDDRREQRVVVVGDGDFLANQYLGNGGNLDLGLNLFNWLGHDDTLVSINPKSAPDLQLELSQGTQILLVVAFLLVIPVALLGTGVVVWIRRRRR
jgi:ABC-type uncharacterized transport system involved in gliding motility auxiliary subunit